MLSRLPCVRRFDTIISQPSNAVELLTPTEERRSFPNSYSKERTICPTGSVFTEQIEACVHKKSLTVSLIAH
jgi:hypothetical protein